MFKKGAKEHAHRKVIGIVMAGLVFTVLVGGNLERVRNDLSAALVQTVGGGACFRTVLSDGNYEGAFVGELADCRSYQGCTYPDGSTCTRMGCFDADGNKSLNSLSGWKVEWTVCRDENGKDVNAVVEEEGAVDEDGAVEEDHEDVDGSGGEDADGDGEVDVAGTGVETPVDVDGGDGAEHESGTVGDEPVEPVEHVDTSDDGGEVEDVEVESLDTEKAVEDSDDGSDEDVEDDEDAEIESDVADTDVKTVDVIATENPEQSPECLEAAADLMLEIDQIRAEIAVAKEFAKAFSELGYMRPDVAAADKLAGNAIKLMDAMEKDLGGFCSKAAQQDSQKKIDKFLDAMERVGDSAEYHFENMVDFILQNDKAYNAVVSKISADKVLAVIEFIGDDEEKSPEVSVESEELNVESKDDDAVVSEAATRVTEHMAVLGRSFGNTLITNNNVVAEGAVELESAAIEITANERRVLTGAKRTIYASNDTARKVAAEIRAFRAAKQSGDARSARARMANIGVLVKKAQEESVTGDNAFEFKDCRMNDTSWFARECVKARANGIVSGYGNGNVGVADNVIRQHAVKMAAGACGKSVKPNRMNWFKPYEDLYYAEGVNKVLGIHLDWSREITREDAFVMLAEFCDIPPTAYRNTWPDGGGKYAGHMQALYDNGIVSGEGNGNLNAGGLINRAQFMKITNIGNDVVKKTRFDAGLIESDFDAAKFLQNIVGGERLSGDPGGEIGGGGSVFSGDPGGEIGGGGSVFSGDPGGEIGGGGSVFSGDPGGE